MAAMLVARRTATVANLIENLRFSTIRPVVAAASRSFATGGLASGQERSVDVSHLSDDDPAARGRSGNGDLFPNFFGGVFDPFNPRRSLSDVFNLMDQMLDYPFPSPWGVGGARVRRGWDVREDENALYLKIDMPGLSKEDVSVKLEQNTLVIKGEAAAEDGAGEEGRDAGRRRYSSRIDLPPGQYDVQGISGEMKNGVLKVVVPRVKAEERKDVHHIQIE